MDDIFVYGIFISIWLIFFTTWIVLFINLTFYMILYLIIERENENQEICQCSFLYSSSLTQHANKLKYFDLIKILFIGVRNWIFMLFYVRCGKTINLFGLEHVERVLPKTFFIAANHKLRKRTSLSIKFKLWPCVGPTPPPYW